MNIEYWNIDVWRLEHIWLIVILKNKYSLDNIRVSVERALEAYNNEHAIAFPNGAAAAEEGHEEYDGADDHGPDGGELEYRGLVQNFGGIGDAKLDGNTQTK